MSEAEEVSGSPPKAPKRPAEGSAEGPLAKEPKLRLTDQSTGASDEASEVESPEAEEDSGIQSPNSLEDQTDQENTEGQGESKVDQKDQNENKEDQKESGTDQSDSASPPPTSTLRFDNYTVSPATRFPSPLRGSSLALLNDLCEKWLRTRPHLEQRLRFTKLQLRLNKARTVQLVGEAEGLAPLVVGVKLAAFLLPADTPKALRMQRGRAEEDLVVRFFASVKPIIERLHKEARQQGLPPLPAEDPNAVTDKIADKDPVKLDQASMKASLILAHRSVPLLDSARDMAVRCFRALQALSPSGLLDELVERTLEQAEDCHGVARRRLLEAGSVWEWQPPRVDHRLVDDARLCTETLVSIEDAAVQACLDQGLTAEELGIPDGMETIIYKVRAAMRDSEK